MIEVQRGEGRFDMEGPEWVPFATGRGIWFKCPQGHLGRLDHEVAADGTVSSSVSCFEPGCGFHDFVRLKEWVPRAP